MVLYYQFDSEDYPYELTYKQVRDAVADICSDNKSDYDVIRDFIYKSDLEWSCFDQYQNELKEYFEDEARQKYKEEVGK